MTQKILIMFVLLTYGSFYGQKNNDDKLKIEKSTIFLINDTEIEAELDFPILDNEKPLKYTDMNGKHKIERNQIKKIVFLSNKGTIEYVSMNVYNETNSKVQKTPKLLVYILKGKISVYITSYINNQFSYNAGANSFGNNGVGFTNYYCIRENEQVASLIHVDSNYANKNIFFRQNGRKYFSDNAEIANKIDSREYTYKNFFEVINLYNSTK